jgi:hypothetical protein
MIRSMRLISGLVCLSAIAVVSPCRVPGQSIHPEEPGKDTFDCGTLALYHLFRIEGRPVELAAIGLHLPALPPAGYSMLELRDAAKACGLRLSGVRLKDPAPKLDGPMIAFLKRGHYVVIRPVGHTGKLVQILNGVERTQVMDKGSLFASSEWTGLVLAPRRSGWGEWVIVPLASLSGLGLLLWLRPRRRSLSPSGHPEPTGIQSVASDRVA